MNLKNNLKELFILGFVIGTILMMNYKVAQKALAKTQPKTSEIHWTTSNVG